MSMQVRAWAVYLRDWPIEIEGFRREGGTVVSIGNGCRRGFRPNEFHVPRTRLGHIRPSTSLGIVPQIELKVPTRGMAH